MVKKSLFKIFRGTLAVNASDLTAAHPKRPSTGPDGQRAEPESGGTTSFEDAIRLAGFGKFHYLLLLVCGLSIMSAILEMLNVGYVLSSAACDFDLTQSDKGVLGAITYIGVICSAHMWGVLGDTAGRRRIIIISLLGDVVVSSLCSLSPNFTVLVFLRFLNGVCVSASSSLSYAYLGEFNTAHNRNRVIVLVGLITGCSALILPGLAWAVLPLDFALPLYGPGLEFKSWRLFLLLCATPSLVAGLSLLLFMPESPKFLLAVGRREEALQVLAHVHKVNTGGRSEYPVRELTEDTSSIMAGNTDRSLLSVLRIVWAQTSPLFQRAFILHTFLVCFIQFGNIASASGLLMWLPELFNYQAKFEDIEPGPATVCEAVTGVLAYNQTTTLPGQAPRVARALSDPTVVTSIIGEALSDMTAPMARALPSCQGGQVLDPKVYVNSLIIGATNSIVPVLGSIVVNKVGKRNLLVFSMVVTGAAAVSLNFVKPYAAILGLACVVISITGMCIAHISSIVVDLFPTNLRAMAVSLSLMCGRLGSMVGNLIFGSLLDRYCDAAFYFFGGVLLVCGLFAMMLPKRGKYSH